MNTLKTILSFVALSSILLGVTACGDNTKQTNTAASYVAGYYNSNPPPRDWAVLAVTPVPKDDRVLVQILVSAPNDIGKIKSISRMEQVAVAKLACPVVFPELRDALGANLRVWVELRANNKTLVESVCPQ